jgi:hypothetical protein
MRRRTRRRRRQNGGQRRVASGISGCALIPGLEAGKVTKVFFKKSDFEAEMAALAISEEADPGHLFTVRGVPDRVEIDATTMALCGAAAHFNRNNSSKYYVIHYDDAGIPPSEMASADRESLLCPLVTLFRHVCEMNKRGYMHGDITPANIAFKDGTFRLIDYGQMRRHTGNQTDKYDMWAIRNFLINFVRNMGIDKSVLDSIPLIWDGGPGVAELITIVEAALDVLCPK